MSIFFIWSMASMTRLAFCGSGSLSISPRRVGMICHDRPNFSILSRSEEHTSELQSRLHLVCRLLLEKKKHTCVFLAPAHISPRAHLASGSDARHNERSTCRLSRSHLLSSRTAPCRCPCSPARPCSHL